MAANWLLIGMSKVQEKDATLLNNLSGSEIADELDSRLRDLEKNLAVAREFIKLADESYSELRHKWNLLHEEVHNKAQTHTAEPAIVADEKTETRTRTKKQSKTKETELTTLNEPKSPSAAEPFPKPQTPAKRAKSSNRTKKEPGITSENASPQKPEKPFRPYRDPGRRHGKNSSN